MADSIGRRAFLAGIILAGIAACSPTTSDKGASLGTPSGSPGLGNGPRGGRTPGAGNSQGAGNGPGNQPGNGKGPGGPNSAEPPTSGPSTTPSQSPSATATATPTTSATIPTKAQVDAVVAEHASQKPTKWGMAMPGILSKGKSFACITLDACGGGAGSGVDTALLDFLIANAVPATLFLNARWIKANPKVLERIAAAPKLEIGNHGTSHVPLSVTGKAAYGIPGTSSAREAADEIMGCQQLIFDRTGTAPKFFRPGTAHWDDVAVALCTELGLIPAGFSINADGGATLRKASVAANISSARAGDISLGHMNRPRAETGAGHIQGITQLLKAGVPLGTLSQAI